MLKEWADKWMVALRSDEFKQGIASLCALKEDGPKYCCLGVLCELVRREEGPGLDDSGLDRIYWGSTCTLPEHVKMVTGIKTSHGVRPDEDGEGFSLVGDNDSRELNFKQIADIIEKYWEVL